MTQQTLLAPVRPPTRPGIDLRLASCADVMRGMEEDADIVFADPPWTYGTPSHTHPTEHYGCLPTHEIADHLAQAYDHALRGARLVLWTTAPLLDETMQAMRSTPWEYVTAGAWGKHDGELATHHGPGWHWAGCAEYVLIYLRRGCPPHRDLSIPLRSSHVSTPEQHSAKPVDWQAEMLRRWTPRGALVLDLYAGLGTVARATLLAGGRRYLGAEIDPARHAAAMAMIAQTPQEMKP